MDHQVNVQVKRNTIDPESIISNYGVTGSYLYYQIVRPKKIFNGLRRHRFSFKFIQKLWNLHEKIINKINENHKKDCDEEIKKYTNKYLKNSR